MACFEPTAFVRGHEGELIDTQSPSLRVDALLRRVYVYD